MPIAVGSLVTGNLVTSRLLGADGGITGIGDAGGSTAPAVESALAQVRFAAVEQVAIAIVESVVAVDIADSLRAGGGAVVVRTGGITTSAGSGIAIQIGFAAVVRNSVAILVTVQAAVGHDLAVARNALALGVIRIADVRAGATMGEGGIEVGFATVPHLAVAVPLVGGTLQDAGSFDAAGVGGVVFRRLPAIVVDATAQPCLAARALTASSAIVVGFTSVDDAIFAGRWLTSARYTDLADAVPGPLLAAIVDFAGPAVVSATVDIRLALVFDLIGALCFLADIVDAAINLTIIIDFAAPPVLTGGAVEAAAVPVRLVRVLDAIFAVVDQFRRTAHSTKSSRGRRAAASRYASRRVGPTAAG